MLASDLDVIDGCDDDITGIPSRFDPADLVTTGRRSPRHGLRSTGPPTVRWMKIWRLEQLGDPSEQLRLVEEDPPTVGAGEVLVDVEAVGLAFPDVLQCRGMYQVKTGPGFTPGGELAGRIAALGDGVASDDTGLDVGRRVVFLGNGGLAEQVVHPASAVFPVPDGVSAETAAAIPINYCTTLYALHERGKLQAGESVLITGAAGGTGTAAIQLANAAGATTIAVAGGVEKAELARTVGADVVIDHQATPDWVDLVREASGGGVDVAYDPVGGDTFHQVRRCMGWDGRLLVIGFVAGIPEVATNHALLKSYSIVGVHWGASLGRRPESLGEQMTTLLEMATTGAVDPPVYPPYAFEDAATALQDLANRQTYIPGSRRNCPDHTIGKLILGDLLCAMPCQNMHNLVCQHPRDFILAGKPT
jgi:NADPH2:quinone reductase